MPELIGHPWRGAESPNAPSSTTRPPRPSRPPRGRSGRSTIVRAAVISLILLGGISMALFAWMRLEERRTIIEGERARLETHLQATEGLFGQIPNLTSRQVQLLRRSLNANHVAAGQRLGISIIESRSDVEERLATKDLSHIDATDHYWVARLSHSVPYVTPAAAAALDTIGVRFARHLGERGLPPFSFHVTSVLRTSEDQANLRRVNVNAARGESSHQFGTTYDLHYRRFRAAVDGRAFVETELGPLPYRFLYDEFAREVERFFDEMAERHAERLGAELGRALIDLETEGLLLAIREARQPVYHVTLNREPVD